MAARANLQIDRGATFSSDVFVTDTDGTAFDLTGYTAAAKMALGYASTLTRVTITAAINNDPTTGIITIIFNSRSNKGFRRSSKIRL
jgi:hypothetical protein